MAKSLYLKTDCIGAVIQRCPQDGSATKFDFALSHVAARSLKEKQT
jgi:hypothetical protein